MKILITGGTGMLGSAFKELKTNHEIFPIGSKHDLRDINVAKSVISKYSPDAIMHLAARVGGVKANMDYVADFYLDNIQINTNVLNAAKDLKVKKVVSLLSTCVYPDKVSYPLTEDQIHNGPPHDSNFGYAYAKRMLDIHSLALRKQHGCNFICAVPNNLYGFNDNFDLKNSHVIPAIIRKVWEAKQSNTPPAFWGIGTPLREFTFSKDIANILIFLLEKYNSPSPINIGTTEEISIKSVVDLVCNYFKYDSEIIWNSSMPSGQFRKPSSNDKLINLGWDKNRFTKLEEGLRQTCDWFVENYPNVRGVR